MGRVRRHPRLDHCVRRRRARPRPPSRVEPRLRQSRMTARRRSLLGLAALGALLCVGSASAAVTLTLPGDIVAEAQGPSGAQITYTASADADPPGKPLDISCDGPGGTSGLGTITVTAVFPLGETTVHCFAHDEHGNEAARGEFTVLVQDTTPPVVTPPGNQTVEAAGPSGNVV